MAEERMRLGHWFGLVICFLWCIDTVGRVAGRTSDQYKNPMPLIHPHFSSGTSGGRKPKEIQLILIHLENGGSLLL